MAGGANPWSGEVALVIGGERHVLKLTLGALAELEAALVDAEMSLSRGRLVALHFWRARARREGSGNLRRIDLTFRARVEET